MTQSEKNLGLRLLAADTEAEVQSIIGGDAAMCNNGNWHPLDGRDTNFNVVNNQASNGGKAATELMTNMVDAILTRRCLEEGILPKSDDAPDTMYLAVDKFIRPMRGGKIIREDGKWLREYAEKNLVIGVTGRVRGGKPCFTFCDNGEGQYPGCFPETFLSLRAKNKSEIRFVQGKYNMGSSGVLNFCGTHWFKLIISRRYDGKEPWGWTLVRRKVPPTGMPYAEYFAPGDKDNIQTAPSGRVFPFNTHDGKQFDDFSLETGTIIKLYQYNVGKSSDFSRLRGVFNQNLVETILPFRLLDFRQKPDPKRDRLRALGIDARPLYGMEFLLVRQHADDGGDEEGGGEPEHIATEQIPGLGEITVTAIPIRKKTEGTSEGMAGLKGSITRFFHHVNGQVQYKKDRGFFTDCGLSALKDRAVVFVDASGLEDRAHQIIWKGDRESILETEKGQEYKDAVKDIIKKSPALKDLNRRIANEMLETASKDSSLNLVKDLVGRDKNFAALLSGLVPDIPVPSPDPVPPTPRSDLQYSPTYLRINAHRPEYSLSVQGVRVLSCDTDAADDYFTRAENRGSLSINDKSAKAKFSVRGQLKNGKLNLFISPMRNLVNAGEIYSFAIELKDAAMPTAVFSEKITLKMMKSTPRVVKPTPPKSPKKFAGLPKHQVVTKDGRLILNGKETGKWAENGCPDFNEEDGGYVQDLGEKGQLYYINYDNAWFRNYRNTLKGEAAAAAAEKYILGMRILMLGFEHALREAPDNIKKAGDDFRRFSAKGAATVVMTICDQLPQSFDLFGKEDSVDGGQ